MKKLMNKKGYVSVETIIVAGLLIALGGFILAGLSRQANTINSDASKQMNVAQKEQQNSFKAMQDNTQKVVDGQASQFVPGDAIVVKP